ncbi:MAG: hypothetical protein KGS61_00390 [Verrucomicrobia bacterium]|nr:hypothetical protein [Verrucomicrobiota bacterium]
MADLAGIEATFPERHRVGRAAAFQVLEMDGLELLRRCRAVAPPVKTGRGKKFANTSTPAPVNASPSSPFHDFKTKDLA